jgi:hypothetical protein
MRWAIVMLSLLGCTSEPRLGPLLGDRCTGLNESDCAHADGCHAVFTSEELCNSVCCASHFEACESGATASCAAGSVGGACNVSCTQTSALCIGSFVQSYSDNGCCPDGCVAISECDGVMTAPSSQCPSGREDTLDRDGSDVTACDPGDLSKVGPQDCPP